MSRKRLKKLPAVGIKCFLALCRQEDAFGDFAVCWTDDKILNIWRDAGKPRKFTAMDILENPLLSWDNGERAACLLLPVGLKFADDVGWCRDPSGNDFYNSHNTKDLITALEAYQRGE